MNLKPLHIVAFDVPFPANYGGVIDVFSRIKCLHQLGYAITLHCYEYGRGQRPELEDYCTKVYYYPRPKRVWDLFSSTPFIVKTRINHLLIKRLKEDLHPIWMEGLHCAWLLNYFSSSERQLLVRVHNIEHHYYDGLAQGIPAPKRWYFLWESRKLKRYEPILSQASHLFAIQECDVEHFKKINPNTTLLPSLPLNDVIAPPQTLMPYVLYQGSLDVEENQKAVVWLIQNVLKHLPQKSKIAGKNPPQWLRALCRQFQIELIENPDETVMTSLIANAKIHLLYTEQDTGLKLRLMNVLPYNGEIIVNPKMVAGTNWGRYCHIANHPSDFIAKIKNILSLSEGVSEKVQQRHLQLSLVRQQVERILSNI